MDDGATGAGRVELHPAYEGPQEGPERRSGWWRKAFGG
jgi:hypothetical protein